MAGCRKVIKYLFKHHPNPAMLDDLPTLVGILYLVDWRSCIEQDKQLSHIQWQIHDGELRMGNEAVRSVMEALAKVKVNPDALYTRPLGAKAKEVLEFVIQTSLKSTPADLIRLIYSTYPLISTEDVEELDLVELAKEYNEIKRFLSSEYQDTQTLLES